MSSSIVPVPNRESGVSDGGDYPVSVSSEA